MLALLIFVLIGGVMLLGAAGIAWFFAWVFFGDKWKANAQERYKTQLPERFNGTPTVVWELGNHSRAPSKDQLVADALEHGYDLDHITAKGQYDQTLVFKKAA